MRHYKKIGCCIGLILAAFFITLAVVCSVQDKVYAANIPETTTDHTVDKKPVVNSADGINNGFSIQYNNESGQISGTVKIFLVLTILSLAPSILIMLTSFTRIIIVLHFVRQAIGTQTAPPNQVLVGLALFLTLFIMAPVFSQINKEAIKPLDAGEITQQEAFKIGVAPLREFMSKETQDKDLMLFCDIAKISFVPDETNLDTIPITVLIPSFILSELRTAFIMGFLIYIPFIVIDMVVASVLMSMGMMMLPPTTISMPFKILLFVLADGWDLIIGSLVRTFY
ncbi:MAG: flagellar type III secretion system pore protein FliP [Lachnospiraceae bacterium]